LLRRLRQYVGNRLSHQRIVLGLALGLTEQGINGLSIPPWRPQPYRATGAGQFVLWEVVLKEEAGARTSLCPLGSPNSWTGPLGRAVRPTAALANAWCFSPRR
jgi:hypothetical protein